MHTHAHTHAHAQCPCLKKGHGDLHTENPKGAPGIESRNISVTRGYRHKYSYRHAYPHTLWKLLHGYCSPLLSAHVLTADSANDKPTESDIN